jgi:ribosome maturation factor RimP
MQDDELGGRIEAIVQPVLDDHGLTLVDIEWHPRRPRGLLRLFVDKPGGVAIDDCERVSREVGDLLDVADVMSAPYDLEVSSPGLERQLRTEREYRWAIGRRVRCWEAGGHETRGRLAAVDAERLVIETDEGRVELPRSNVTKARLDADVPWPRRANA